MVKKLSALALAGMLCLPAAVWADSSADDLAGRIDQLTRELNKLKSEMSQLRNTTEQATSEIEESSSKVDLSSRFQLYGDFRSRIDYVNADTPSYWGAMDVGSGVADFMTVGAVMDRYAGLNGALNAGAGATVADFAGAFAGYNPSTKQITNAGDTPVQVSDNEVAAMGKVFGSATMGAFLGGMMAFPIAGVSPNFTNLDNLIAFMNNTAMGMSPAVRSQIFQEMGYNLNTKSTYENKTLWTNRFRLNMRVKATEDVTFKGRLGMYKAWGMQNSPVDYTLMGGPFMLSSMAFDGSSTRQPTDSIVRVDRAYVNWTNIAGQPIWFSIGRRPTTDGPPSQLRQGVDQRMATPTAYMDYPFDGLTLGRAYESLFGIEDFPGRIRFCYGRGFDSGPTENGDGLSDVDFAGISWDVYNKGDRFFTFQSFIAFNMFNVPDGVNFPNPIEYAKWQIDPSQYNPMDPNKNNILDRTNLGDIYHTTAVYMDKKEDLNYFLSLGWSHTDPRDGSKGMDELGTSLLGSFGETPKSKDGYSVYAGIRYDIPDKRLKLGLEYNYGTENWIGFTPGHDDIYQSKLATRGHVGEAYMIYDFPAGEKISKYADFFMRLGYMHYKYEYTGSGFWLGTPIKVDDLKNDPLSAQFYTPTDEEDQVYLTVDAYF